MKQRTHCLISKLSAANASSHHSARWFGVGFSLETKFREVFMVFSKIAHFVAYWPGFGDN